MIKAQFFAHRPPSEGIHLLRDPFPRRLRTPQSSRATSGSGPITLSPKVKKSKLKIKAKKSGLRA